MADVWVNSMACHPKATYHIAPIGEFTVMIPEPHATLQGVRIPSAMLKIVFRHIYFIFVFFHAVWALTSGGFRIVFDTVVCQSIISSTMTSAEACFVSKRLASTWFRKQLLGKLLVQRRRGSSGK